MAADHYSRAVLTVIAAALLYLCVILTPWPAVSAQRGLRPGDDTGPAQAVVVGWKATDPVPVQLIDSITLKTTGEVRVAGTVETVQKANSAARVVLTGWEERGRPEAPGTVYGLEREGSQQGPPPGLPVTAVPVR